MSNGVGWVRRTIVGAFALVQLVATGCDKRGDDLAAQIQQLNARLQQGVQAPSAADIHAVFSPLQEAFARLADQVQADRQRTWQLVSEVRSLAAMVESAAGAGGQKTLQAMRERLDGMERRLSDQSTRNDEDKQLMIRALEASTERLDRLLKSVRPAAGKDGGAPPDPGTGGVSGGKGGGAGGERAPNKPFLERIDLNTTIVVFLAVSLFLTVLVVVFFPGRLRRTVPEIEYEADPRRAPDVQDPGVVTAETEALDPPVPPRRLADASQGGQLDGNPVPHELALTLDDQRSLEGLVEILDAYLNTEPYILRNPAPRVALVQGQLHLQFYALPNLSKTEHALLDATVRRLRPRREPTPEDAPAA